MPFGEVPNHYETPIRQTEQPMRELCEQLKPHLEKGEYVAIIGDDTSGRIPTLIVGDVIGEVYRQKGFEKIPTLFVPGGQLVERKVEKEVVKKVAKYLGDEKKRGKVLVVTESIESGTAISRMGELLTNQGIKYDIAAMFTIDPPDYYKTSPWIIKPIAKGTEIFAGTHDVKNMKVVYNKPWFSGVFPAQYVDKDTPLEVKSVNNKTFVQVFRPGGDMVKAARADVKLMADKILGDVFNLRYSR